MNKNLTYEKKGLTIPISEYPDSPDPEKEPKSTGKNRDAGANKENSDFTARKLVPIRYVK